MKRNIKNKGLNKREKENETKTLQKKKQWND